VEDEWSRENAGRRFPIELVAYNPRWPELYEEEARLLKEQFGDLIIRIEHIGSTAVPGLAAKDTIDILVEIPSFEVAEREIVPVLMDQAIGYGYPNGSPPGHMAFWKGYLVGGQKYHYHMAPAGHPIHDRVYFRDYLRRHPDTAREYEALKYRLAEIYHYDREGYTEAKADFIVGITEITKKELSTTA
jgi:GrpB-like predicted nucleotidyltransferase (UPF0157 family)